jgi:hypothetical protein
MTNDLVKKPETLPDQIDGYTEGSKDGAEGLGRADWIRYTKAGDFMLGETIINGARRVAVNIVRSVVKRNDDFQEIERKPLAESESWPDVEQKNEATPRAEWRKDANGEVVGPWSQLREVMLVDMRDMGEQIFPTSTTGGRIGVSDLARRIQHMRKFRGARVFPEVELVGKVSMGNKYGTMRPHFRVVRWLMLGLNGQLIEVPSDPTKPLPAIAAAPQAHVTEVKETTLAEEAADQVPF